MDDFIRKEDRENIKELNRFLGTKYRTRPYDMKNTKDIIEATMMATAEFVDFAYYWRTLFSLEEYFDETLEVFHPSAWVNLGLKGTTGRDDLDWATHSLQETVDVFYNLLAGAEEKCAKMWRIVFFHSHHEVKVFFFGVARDYDTETVEQVLTEQLFEVFTGVDYDGVVEHSARMFARELEGMILE